MTRFGLPRPLYGGNHVKFVCGIDQTAPKRAWQARQTANLVNLVCGTDQTIGGGLAGALAARSVRAQDPIWGPHHTAAATIAYSPRSMAPSNAFASPSSTIT